VWTIHDGRGHIEIGAKKKRVREEKGKSYFLF
jgi:hypothetical protein